MTATRAATVQLSVPVLAAGGGVVLMSESVSLRLVMAGILILGGVGGGIGHVRGSFSLSFEYDGKTLSNHGDYLSILRRLPDGSWRISHRAWNDLEQ